jgi:hypothetical protein
MRKKLTRVVTVLTLIVAFALPAWAAVYVYGGGTTRLDYVASGTYTCPSAGQTVRASYGVNGNTIWDSYGTVVFFANLRDSASGPIHYHERRFSGSIEFDTYTRGWDTGHRYMTALSAQPSGLSAFAPMQLVIWCQ